ncbi:hypothetical protein B0J14DRAFT_685218 [Halenospora varia]|nr:hypothetical protein B0J14DRAFT_685218 [Halenospora varia]
MQDLKSLLECIDGLLERISADLESIKGGFELFHRWKKESSGKSKLVSIVIKDAKKAFHNSQSPALVFFYYSQNTAKPARSSPDAIIATIARQLSCLQPGHPLLPLTVAAYKKQEMEGFASGSLGIDESRALILQLVKHYLLTTIMIDALDKCDLERRADLLETLELILQESSSLVKIFVSSRRDHDIVLHLQDYPNLKLSSEMNKDDISSFVTTKTYNLIKRKKLLALSTNKENLKTEIIKQVTKNTDGMFRVRTDEAIRERLGRLPPKLEDLYLELYKKLTKTSADTDREVTINAFSWLLYAQRTLTSIKFLAALSTTPWRQFNQLTKEHILEMCSNMVVFDPTLDTFRFAHLSIREFLEKRPEYTREATNALAAKTCLLDAPHCQLAANQRTTSMLKDLLYHFLSNDSDPRSAVIVWASRIKERFNDYSIKLDLTRRLQDTEAYSSQSLFIACCFDLQEVMRAQTTSAKYLVNSQAIEEEVVKAAAGNEESGKEVTILLLQHHGADIVITEEVVKAVAGNGKSGKEVIMVLLEQHGADVVITEEVVKAAVGNEESGKEVMMVLLKERGADVVITEEVVKAAAGNGKSGKEVMMVLLEERGADIVITEEVVKVVVGNYRSGKEVMILLLEQCGADVVITKEVVKTIASQFREEVIMVLLEEHGADMMITEEVVKAAAGNYRSGKEVMMVLLEQRGANVVITKEVIKAAAGNGKSGKEVMMVLLEERGADIVITEEVVKVVVGNYRSGKEVMILLLEQCGADVVITKEVVKTIASQFREEVIMVLLEEHGADMMITEEVVKAAAGNYRSGKEVMMVLLEQRGANVVITKEVIKAAAGNGKSGKEVMMVLLEERGADIVITEEVVKVVVGNYRSGKEVMILLLEQCGADIVITKEVVKTIASQFREEVIMVLLEERGADVVITEEVVKAAAGNY